MAYMTNREFYEHEYKRQKQNAYADALVKEVRRLREEKQEREKGCEYCSGDVDERLTLIDSDDGYAFAYIDGNGKLTLNDMDDVQINFCPMCGKSLKEVAND